MYFNLTLTKITGEEVLLSYNDVELHDLDKIKNDIIEVANLDDEEKEDYREEDVITVMDDLLESFTLEVYDESSCVLTEKDLSPFNIEQCIEELNPFTSAKEIFQSLDDTYGLDCAEWHPFDEEFFEVHFTSPMEVARATHYGDLNWSDDYIRFNEYGNLETISFIDYDSEFEEIVERYIDENL